MHPLGDFTMIIILDQNMTCLFFYVTQWQILTMWEREIIDTLLYLYLVSALQIWNKVQFIEIGTVIGGSYQIAYVNLREDGLLGLMYENLLVFFIDCWFLLKGWSESLALSQCFANINILV